MHATASKQSESTSSTAQPKQAQDSSHLTLQRKSNGHDSEALGQMLAQGNPGSSSHGSPAIHANSPSIQLSRLVKTATVQPKLKIGKPNDRFEQEADQMADKVMAFPSPGAQPALQLQTAKSLPSKPLIQRQAEEEEKKSVQAKSLIQRQPAEEEEVQAKSLIQRQAEEEEESVQSKSLVQRQPAEEEEEAVQAKYQVQRQEEEEEVQTKGIKEREGGVSGSLESRLGAGQGSGKALSPGIQAHMGSRMGADFSGVRVHTDSDAAQMSTALNAQAFTHGSDIYFNQGNYDPDSSQGRRLLSHELTHVVQQGQADAKSTAIAQKSSEEEQEKEGVEVQAKAETGQISAAPVGIQRGIWDSITGAAGAVWDATAGKLVDAAGQAIEMTSDLFWSLLENVAPGFVPIVREIASKGIIGFLKDRISQAVNRIFDGLSDGSGVLIPLFETFKEMVGRAAEIVVALANKDCAPLFAALNQLKETISRMAGEAWNAITDFFAPIGAFFSNVWQSFGAPVLDWLGQTATDVWEFIKGLGKQIWDWTQPVRDAVGGAWDWVKGKLGIGGEEGGESEGGLVQWIKDKAEEAWGAVKEQLSPIIEPIQAVVEKVQAILPLDAIFNLRETVQGWLSKAEAMGQAMGEDGGNVAEEQTSLRDEILPAILERIESLRAGLISAGFWISEKIGSIVFTVTGFITSLSSSPLVSGLRSAVVWIQTGLQQLAEWAQTKVVALFNLVGDGLVMLSRFVRPVLDVLNQIVETLKNLMGKLPDLILGPVWWILPDCIKNPIKDFILNQILMRIPFFQQFLALGDIWAKVKATAMKILKQVFVDGDLFGALWTYFKAVLGIFGIPPQLITNIIIKAAQALGDILANPIGFIINILKAVKEGFVRFFSNILKHLLGGVTGWLFGQMEDAGIEIPKDFSLKSILNMVFQILGLTMEKIWKKLADKIGQDKVDKLKEGIKLATGAWEWIKIAATEGPGAIWEKLKEKLSDLWTAVITGVVGWVNQVIIVQGTKWLLSLVDVSGITPTITATIALYKAIESFFAYLKQMLEIVNTVLNGIADLAKGAIGTAAGFLESALAKSVPIIIGFLANQFGLGRLGSKIAEIIGAVRGKVDDALDWIIGKAVDTGAAFLEMLKSGAAAVKEGVAGFFQWWKRKKIFKTSDGRDHSIYIEGDLSQPKVIVESDPIGLPDLINEVKDETTKQAIQDKYAALLTFIHDNKEIDADGENEKTLDLQAGIDTRLGNIANDLRVAGVFKDELPPTNITYNFANSKADTVRAEPLTKHPGNTKGSEAPGSSAEPKGWELAQAYNRVSYIRDEEGNYLTRDDGVPRTSKPYKRVHLVAWELHGPAEVWNLVPAVQQVNSDFASRFETDLKQARDNDEELSLKVKVQYYGRSKKDIERKNESGELIAAANKSDYPENFTVTLGKKPPENDNFEYDDPFIIPGTEVPNFEGATEDFTLKRQISKIDHFLNKLKGKTEPVPTFSDFRDSNIFWDLYDSLGPSGKEELKQHYEAGIDSDPELRARFAHMTSSEEEEVLQEIKDLKDSGMTNQAIADKLTAEGRLRRAWTEASVRRWLKKSQS